MVYSYSFYKDQCVKFSNIVLNILEDNEEWDADTVDEISKVAMDLHLAYCDSNGYFKNALLTKSNKENYSEEIAKITQECALALSTLFDILASTNEEGPRKSASIAIEYILKNHI